MALAVVATVVVAMVAGGALAHIGGAADEKRAARLVQRWYDDRGGGARVVRCTATREGLYRCALLGGRCRLFSVQQSAGTSESGADVQPAADPDKC